MARLEHDTAFGPDMEPDVMFAVVMERVVGEVRYGKGEHNPMEAAMLVIGSNGEEGRYRFPGPGENETVVVEVTFVREADR